MTNKELQEKPKYDPCRRFKKGDKVRIVQCKGRDFNREAKLSRGKVAEVLYDEVENVLISVFLPDKSDIAIDPAYLELVTPVSEREPYSVIDSPRAYNIVQVREKKLFTSFYKDQPHAKEEAEKYCKQLNDAWRKEQGK